MNHKFLSTLLLLFILLTGCKEKKNNQEEKSFNIHSVPISPCRQIKLIGKDSLKRKIMKETIDFFLVKNCFANNRGIVMLIISLDKRGNEVWTMYSAIEDKHMWRSQVTPLFEDFDGDIVMIYDKNYVVENSKMSEQEQQAMRECMDQVIGNRVYQRPTRKDRWTERFFVFEGDTIRQGQGRGSTGTACKRIIVFNEDETDYKVLF